MSGETCLLEEVVERVVHVWLFSVSEKRMELVWRREIIWEHGSHHTRKGWASQGSEDIAVTTKSETVEVMFENGSRMECTGRDGRRLKRSSDTDTVFSGIRGKTDMIDHNVWK